MIQPNRQKDIAKDLMMQIKRESYIKECFHGDNQCSTPIISAHSIQNNRILNKMSKNGEVLYFCMNEKEGERSFLQAPIGRKKATTFTGFCSKHDREIFIPIESFDYQERNKEQEFLFAYRALAKEYHSKKQSIKLLQAAKGKLMYSNPQLDMYLEGSQCSLSEIERHRQLFNTALDNQEFDIIGTRVIAFQEEYHVAVSSVFTIEKDMNGKVVNDHSCFNVELKFFCFTIFPQNGKTFILFSYLKKYKKYLNPVINYILKSKIKDRKIIISNLIAAYVENVVLSPVRWEKMADSEKMAFQNLFNKTLFTAGDELNQPKNINLFV